jgi:hypothetical protein
MSFSRMVTQVSVTPIASFANVFPVHGTNIRTSRSFCGPIGSACAMCMNYFFIANFSKTLNMLCCISNRVVSRKEFSDIMGNISQPVPCNFSN